MVGSLTKWSSFVPSLGSNVTSKKITFNTVKNKQQQGDPNLSPFELIHHTNRQFVMFIKC